MMDTRCFRKLAEHAFEIVATRSYQHLLPVVSVSPKARMTLCQVTEGYPRAHFREPWREDVLAPRLDT